MKLKYIIYSLNDPITGTIRYVGKSTQGLARCRDHFKKKYELNKTTRKANWINKLLREGLEPVIEILAVYDNAEILNEEEIRFIKMFKDQGYDLTNLTNGGEGNIGWSPSEETRRKMSEKRKTWSTGEPWNKRKHIIDNNGIEKRNCAICKHWLPIAEYGKSRSNSHGLNTRCMPCHNEDIKKRRNKPETKKRVNKQTAELRSKVRQEIIHHLPHACDCNKTYKTSILISPDGVKKNISSILSINLPNVVSSLKGYRVICKSCA